MEGRPAPQLMTVGYQERSREELAELLVNAGVTVVVDVRESPRSRRPGFSARQLAEFFPKHGVRYVHLPAVGNPKAFRKSGASHAEILAQYEAYLGNTPAVMDELEAALTPLIESGERVALMCYERHPDDCHRGFLARNWRHRHDGEVEHLEPTGARRLAPPRFKRGRT